MWQRIQTLYLGVATLLIVSLFWCDVARKVGADTTVENISYTSSWIYMVWLILLTVLQVLALGGYKWRMKQFRIAVIAGIMCLAFQGWLVFDYIKLHESFTFSWTALFPLAAAFLDYLGVRNILLDEAIVQSAHRLRSARTKKH
ncbi:MAG: DUF4293 domain-containing protein [Bacteroidales bacterium]|nr:DUF4293 domain-containing protein [Candidatus Hennigimonas equi]